MFAKGLFSASAEYSGYIQSTSDHTWSEKTKVTHTISVEKGQSVVTWQYRFKLSQFGDSYTYYGSIVEDNNDPNSPPKAL